MLWGLGKSASRHKQQKQQQPEQQHRCYIGIDLGTSRSGYSYAFGHEPSCIKFPQQYTHDDLYGQAKTDTALLFEVDHSSYPSRWNLHCWGTSAVLKYTQLALTGHAASQYRLITGKQFKLILGAPHPSHLPPDCQLPPDCPYTPAELIPIMLRCLKEHVRQQLVQSNGLDLDSAAVEVHYCLSVPAGCSLQAKRVMHQAAEQAGMTLTRVPRSSSNNAATKPSRSDSTNSTYSNSSSTSSRTDVGRSNPRDQNNRSAAAAVASASAVVLVHEQESAALTACIDPMRDVPTLRAVPGQMWMILDAGGGTVDIAMHQIEASTVHPGESQLSELLRSRCLLWGSSRLDIQAEMNLLMPLFGSQAAYEQWKVEDPQSYVCQMREWEDVKAKWDGSSTIYLKLDFNLLTRWLPPNPPTVHRGCLPVSPADMSQLVFEPVLQPVLDNVRDMLLATQRITGSSVGADVLVLAGGFGSSPYLQRRLAESCGHLIKQPPVKPNNTARAVLLGNSIHLQRPTAISAPVSRLTYGINVAVAANDACREHGKSMTDAKGRTWCTTGTHQRNCQGRSSNRPGRDIPNAGR